MIKWTYTDSPEEQDKSVTTKRNFYIGGSELNKIFEDFYKGDIIQNIFEKLCYIDVSHESSVQPDWAEFGHKAEEIIRQYVNKKFNRNYRPAVSINNAKQSRTNVDGYDENAEEQLWECKTYSGKENIEKYMKQITYYMLRNNIDSCLLTTLSKDVLDRHGKKIRNITLEELTDEELEKRLSFHIIKFDDVRKLAEQIDTICSEYSKLYNYISNSKLMQKYIEDYKAMIFTQNSMVETFMDSFK
jgi:hypothetical protein